VRLIIRGVFWFGFYVLMILFPLLVGAVLINPADSPFFLVNLAAAFGYIGLALMTVELALVSRSDGAAGAFGEDALLQFHREIGISAFVLVLMHPILLIASAVYKLNILVPWGGTPWPVSLGIAAFVAALLVVGLSLMRRRLGTPYEIWQASHGAFSMTLIVLAGAHIYAVGRFSTLPVMRVLWVVYIATFVGMFLRYRLIRPMRLKKQPWEVVENRLELGNSYTVRLRPVGHYGFTFEPGQFAWLGFDRSPFALTMHPISLSSNGDIPMDNGEIAFTIKDLGDWSGEVVPNVKPGDRAWVDGPHGVFSMDREEGAGYALIGGGVGITPLHAMLLAMEERGDVRPVVVFYGANDEGDLTFNDEFHDIERRMSTLTVVRVLAAPSDEWTGERGFINVDVLRRYLPEKLLAHFQYFICGPTPLMDAMENALPEIGVPVDRIHTERFDMV
jgi:predicted ferric reductase